MQDSRMRGAGLWGGKRRFSRMRPGPGAAQGGRLCRRWSERHWRDRMVPPGERFPRNGAEASRRCGGPRGWAGWARPSRDAGRRQQAAVHIAWTGRHQQDEEVCRVWRRLYRYLWRVLSPVGPDGRFAQARTHDSMGQVGRGAFAAVSDIHVEREGRRGARVEGRTVQDALSRRSVPVSMHERHR